MKTKSGLSWKMGVFGILMCTVGVALGWGILPSFIRNKISKAKNLAPGSEGRKLWEKLPFPVIFKMHIFNVTNPEAVNAGEIPNLEEIGPYIFQEWKEKVDLKDIEENDTVTFYMKNTWIFDKANSWPLTGDEIVVVPHPALLGIVLTAEREKPAFLQLLGKALPSIFGDPKDIFLRTTAMDLLFNGNYLNCTGASAFPVKAVCSMLRKKAIFPESEPGIFKFSVFGNRNGTKENDEYCVYRGTRDIQKIGQMYSYKGQREQSVWKGTPCNSIAGTDSTIFPPFLEKENIRAFTSDICRSMISKYSGVSSYKLIPTFAYSSDFGDMSVDPELKCFCPSADNCLKRGVMDLMNCQGAPLIASLPHFYDAHEDYSKGVHGLSPDKLKHGISVHFEAMTGTPLSAKKRLQFSLPVHQVKNINLTNNLSEAFVPFLWVEEGIELNDDILGELKSKLLNVVNAIEIGKWVMAAGGAGTAVIGAVLNFVNPFSREKIISVIV